jgi:hypothetical protein
MEVTMGWACRSNKGKQKFIHSCELWWENLLEANVIRVTRACDMDRGCGTYGKDVYKILIEI